MIKSRVLCSTILTALLGLCATTSDTWACSSIIVGKNASANGYVMLGHTEDISPQPVINQHRLPRKQHEPGEITTLPRGGQLSQVKQTWSCIWSEVPGEDFCDGYLNEWGVTIASNQCPSREDESDLTDGGIGFMLRRIVARRATTAREGVKLAGELVEKFGYYSTGRTYSICDPNEGWVFCAIKGRHWVARRVPDDHVAVIANSYTVREIDLTDTLNFLAAEDLVDYAISRGWYDPAKDSAFDFAKVYADSTAASASYNVCRQWSGLRYIVDDTVHADWGNLPFSLKADRTMSVLDVMEILRHHYENTALYQLPSDSSSPHESQFMTTCSQRSQMSFVAELRADRSKEIGLVYWLSLGKPCYSYLVPFYFGMDLFPDAYYTQPDVPDSALVNRMITAERPSDFEPAFLKFSNYSHQVDSNYAALGQPARRVQVEYDRHTMEMRDQVEASAAELLASDREQAIAKLMSFSANRYQAALQRMEDVLAGRDK
jgi:dipeptidase